MRINGELNKKQFKALQDSLTALELPAQKRQRLLWRMAKHGVIAAAKRHVRQQTDENGRPWAPRKRKNKRPMLRNLPKLIKIKEIPAQQAVRLYFSGGKYRNGKKAVAAGIVAGAHHDGMTTTIKKSQLKNNQDNAAPVTPQQVKRLRALGYSIMKKGRYVKAPASYIRAHLTQAQAGLILRVLRNKPTKTAWTIQLPSRVFLQVSDSEFSDILARQLQGINYGGGIKKQDIRG